MSFKIGDKVRFIKDCGFKQCDVCREYIGRIMTITDENKYDGIELYSLDLFTNGVEATPDQLELVSDEPKKSTPLPLPG